jgi:hypothetical protein
MKFLHRRQFLHLAGSVAALPMVLRIAGTKLSDAISALDRRLCRQRRY